MLGLISGIPISVIDLRTRRIPDYLSIGTLVLVVAVVTVFEPSRLKLCLIGAGIGFGTFWLLSRLTGGKLGMGDVKYSAMIGAALGPTGWFWAVLSASLLGLAIVGFLLSLRTIERSSRIPFGPFLAAGSVISAVFGTALTGWMLGGPVL